MGVCPQCHQQYDYEDDSNFEEEEESDDEPAVTPRKSRNNSQESVAIKNYGVKSSKPSDIVSISDLDPLLSESSTATTIHPSFRVLQNSRRGKRPSDTGMAMTATSRIVTPVMGVPWTVTRV